MSSNLHILKLTLLFHIWWIKLVDYLNAKSTFHSWNKWYLNMMCYLFMYFWICFANILKIVFASTFIEGYCLIIFFPFLVNFCQVFVLMYIRFMNWVEKYSLKENLLFPKRHSIKLVICLLCDKTHQGKHLELEFSLWMCFDKIFNFLKLHDQSHITFLFMSVLIYFVFKDIYINLFKTVFYFP